MHTAFGVPLVITGIVTAILAGAVFFGGVARLASVTEKIVPFMAAIYIMSLRIMTLRTIVIATLSEDGEAKTFTIYNRIIDNACNLN